MPCEQLVLFFPTTQFITSNQEKAIFGKKFWFWVIFDCCYSPEVVSKCKITGARRFAGLNLWRVKCWWNKWLLRSSVTRNIYLNDEFLNKIVKCEMRGAPCQSCALREEKARARCSWVSRWGAICSSKEAEIILFHCSSRNSRCKHNKTQKRRRVINYVNFPCVQCCAVPELCDASHDCAGRQ